MPALADPSDARARASAAPSRCLGPCHRHRLRCVSACLLLFFFFSSSGACPPACACVCASPSACERERSWQECARSGRAGAVLARVVHEATSKGRWLSPPCRHGQLAQLRLPARVRGPPSLPPPPRQQRSPLRRCVLASHMALGSDLIAQAGVRGTRRRATDSP